MCNSNGKNHQHREEYFWWFSVEGKEKKKKWSAFVYFNCCCAHVRQNDWPQAIYEFNSLSLPKWKWFTKEVNLERNEGEKKMATNNVLNRLKKLTTEERVEMKEKFADVSKYFHRYDLEQVLEKWLEIHKFSIGKLAFGCVTFIASKKKGSCGNYMHWK